MSGRCVVSPCPAADLLLTAGTDVSGETLPAQSLLTDADCTELTPLRVTSAAAAAVTAADEDDDVV